MTDHDTTDSALRYAPPDSESVDARTLARIFRDVTNSYKFLFFLALLDNLERNCFDPAAHLALDDILLDMLTLAWYPHVYFRLSFGKSDQIAGQLDAYTQSTIEQQSSIKPWDKNSIRRMIAETADVKKFRRFVPYRLVRPFFPETVGMKKDHQVDARVAELCAEYFVSRKPIYKFDAEQTEIILHPDWCHYFHNNLPIIRAWAWWHFLLYMQRCNPNVPAIANKLSAPPERLSLSSQTAFWRTVLDAAEFHCIYSGQVVDARDFALDHFVPWSFVVHDQLWNLIPTSKAVNSSKSNRLPSPRYLDEFVSAQHSALLCTKQILKAKTWEDHAGSCISDFGLRNFEELLNLQQLKRAFELNVLPLLQLAEANGFEPAWTFAGS